VISKCERDRHIEDPAPGESALVICEMLWHDAASERKRVAPRSEKVYWILRKDLKNKQQVPYWPKAADNTEPFLFSICVNT
jgi:hypothetical protein